LAIAGAAKLIITATAAPVRTILFIIVVDFIIFSIPFRISVAIRAACKVNIGAARPKGDQLRGRLSRLKRMSLLSTDRLLVRDISVTSAL
jgi:hypothetical protein